MKKTISIIVFLYAIFMATFLWCKYVLEDQGQCGRCVQVCSSVCLESKPCSFWDYTKTYFDAAYNGCRNILK